MGTIKDRNTKDLTKVEEIKKRWQECTKDLQKRGLNDPDIHHDVITHLEQTSQNVKSSVPQEVLL